MIQIRPVSDLRNKYPEVERLVTQQQQPVFLTKNGYGSMVVMSIEQYTALIDGADAKLDEAMSTLDASGAYDSAIWIRARGWAASSFVIPIAADPRSRAAFAGQIEHALEQLLG